jgi:ABC-type Fe3+/spermidine/putrescine transport system ATPase subunit
MLNIAGVSKRFAARQVLVDLSLTVPSESILFIAGPSGCGKSTLLRVIAGLESQESGRITVDGRCLDGLSPAQRGLGLVFQNYALWPHMTVTEHLEFALGGLKLPRNELMERIGATLRLVELAEYGSVHPAKLSGGQQQRLALARSLVLSPKLLLLDEPFSNLDLKLRRQVISALRAIQREVHLTFVIVTHDIEAVIQPQDRLAVLRAATGELKSLVQEGTYEEVSSNPSDDSVREITGQFS